MATDENLVCRLVCFKINAAPVVTMKLTGSRAKKADAADVAALTWSKVFTFTANAAKDGVS